MPRPFPAEFRVRAVALVRAGKPVSRAAAELGISQACLHNWLRQDRVDRGELAGVPTSESAELRQARKRIRQLELEVEILTKASKFLAEDMPHPKGFTR
jgi:transposase-like protein